ncbi:MAG: oligopeptide transporter, OPT family [Acidobacteria bacterium]|nr:oligopeptide transporter, OPT family [Acidobacteriota bacterium]
MSQDPSGETGGGGARQLSPAAYRELKPGETFEPYIAARELIPEFTARAVTTGIAMAIIFSVAATYSGLKVAQVFEAAIPIGILTVGLSGLFRRRNTILENVIVQSVGAASGLVVAGSIFTLPALYIMNVAPSTGPMLLTMFITSVLGSLLGIVFLIPLRRYFMVEQHGKLPFPEATAINEVFVTGEAGGEQARVLVLAAGVGGIFDFLATSVKAWSEIVNFQFIPVVKNLAVSAKATVSLNAVSLILGLGFITGLRYSAIICAGSFFSTLVLVPLIYHLGQGYLFPVPPAPLPNYHVLIGDMSATELFRLYAQRIGVGAMAGAGIIGIIKSLPTICSAFSLGFHEIFHHKKAGAKETARTDRDLKMSTILLVIVLTLAALLAFFFILMRQDPNSAAKAPQIALTGLAIAFIFSFLFTTVAALATAMTGNNPISGMTLVTLIVGSTLLVSVGLAGDFGKFAAIVMGAVVCSALAMSGGFVTDLKVGYWLGSTPRYQQISKIIGTLFAAVGVALTVLLIHTAYGSVDSAGAFISGFKNTAVVPAPQANLFATILSGIFDKAPVTWALYGMGLALAVILEMMKIPPLAFAIGMYLPIEINTPLFVGGVISHFVAKSSRDKAVSEDRVRRGTLLASGFIAGGAIMGVVGALLVLADWAKYIDMEHLRSSDVGQMIGAAAFAGLCLFLYLNSKRARPVS